MPKFSSRFGFDPRVPKEPVLEDAPEWLRIGYIGQILDDLTYLDKDSRQRNDEQRPLGIKQLYLDFCGTMRQEPEGEVYDTACSWDYLKSLVKNAEWFYFYDFVELVGTKLKVTEEFSPEEWQEKYGFEAYRRKVNQLFSEERIGWRLGENSELARQIPKSLSTRIEATTSLLQDNLAPARKHCQKAHRYLFERPIDPENAIKEITSALESVGRVFYPKAKTLGDVAAEMKKKKLMPPMLISVIEKFYGYTSSEPAVRHGDTVVSRVAIADAEFCFHSGIALIRYLVEKHSPIGR